MRRASIIAVGCGLAGPLIFAVASTVGGLLIPGYDPLSQLISESYARDTVHGGALRFWGFLPSGLLIAAFAWAALRCVPASSATRLCFTAIGIFYGLGTATTCFFPCDAGCNKEFIDPSLSQVIHNLSGLLTYLVVPPALILGAAAARSWPRGRWFSTLAFTTGGLTLVFAWLLLIDPHAAFAGLYQRIAEGSILVWITSCAWYVRTAQRIDPT